MSTNIEQIKSLLLSLLPKDGSTVGNLSLKDQIRNDHQLAISHEDFDAARNQLVNEGIIGKGRGRGGATYLNQPAAGEQSMPDGFELQTQQAPSQEDLVYSSQKPASPKASRQPAKKKGEHSQVLSYRYDEKRKNNPHVGMVDTHSDGEERKTTWQYDPHLSPELQFDSTRSQVESLIENSLHSRETEAKQAKDDLLMWLDHALAADNEAAIREVVSGLRKRVADKEFLERERDDLAELRRMQAPYLNWTGKAERTSFEVDTVSLHVHERIDPATILAAVQKRVKDAKGKSSPALQPDLFHAPFENLPLRDAIDFYKHERDWANRMIAGDSLLVMNSLLKKEGMEGQVKLIYMDPPYGIKYGSNFQPFTNKKPSSRTDKDEDLTQEPEMIKAFRDTWSLGLHSYLSYLRDRLLLCKELLREDGSLFFQISDENHHYSRQVIGEVFGENNIIVSIPVKKKGSQKGGILDPVNDYLIWVAKDKDKFKSKKLYVGRESDAEITKDFSNAILSDGTLTTLSKLEKEDGVRIGEYKGNIKKLKDQYDGIRLFKSDPSTGGNPGSTQAVEFKYLGLNFDPGISRGLGWKASAVSRPGESLSGMDRLAIAGRVYIGNTQIGIKRYPEDFGLKQLSNWWDNLGGAANPIYVVQTNEKVIERCLLLASDPGDLVFDPTCGSGTTALVAEKWGRRWITCDTSRIAIALAKQRLMTASFDYFELKYPNEGLKGGFIYRTVSHVTASGIANNSEIDGIYLKMMPKVKILLSKLNKELRAGKVKYKINIPGARQGQTIDLSGGNTEMVTLPSGDEINKCELQEWEVPFSFPDDWPTEARKIFEDFLNSRRLMQQHIEESIANSAEQEVLYDLPKVSSKKLRITGPFTVEAVPFATVLGLEATGQSGDSDSSIARSGATSRNSQWREELIRTGIRGKGGQVLKLQDLEALPGSNYVHAIGTVAENGERVAVSFGPEHAALEQRQVEIAMREAGDLFPLPKMLVFCAFNFDPEAAKDIDNIRGIQAIRVQMNTDLLTEDLKKAGVSNQSFWLMGQPDVQVHALKDGHYQVEVHGFDYFDTKTGELKSGGKKNIAMWQLDTDYDNRSLFARQVFFPMAGKKDGWYKLKQDIRAELKDDLLGKFHGTKSIPFELGDNCCIAVKIVDDRGIESLKVIRLD